MTGMDLKLQRVAKRITTIALADRAGWKSRTRVSQIEAQAVVNDAIVRRYLDALETFA